MPPHKKRRLSSPPDIDPNVEECVQEIAAEIDLEIGVKQRLADTIESRITWALILQESLQKENASVPSTSFRNAAFDALSAIEAPCEFLFAREVPAPPRAVPVQPKTSRPPPRPKYLNARSTTTNFLYIRSAALDPGEGNGQVQTYLLRCPTCLRTAFTSLQGLLNHARISHGLEWGTHDECVRACAVVDPDLNVDSGIEVRLGPGGILPGLRSIFQMAVGTHQLRDHEPALNGEGGSASDGEGSRGNHLSRTLGLHEDTPALAQFLGKQSIRRGIKVWDEENDIDIDGPTEGHIGGDDEMNIDTQLLPETPRKPRRAWRMLYTHRNTDNSVTDVDHGKPPAEPEGAPTTNPSGTELTIAEPGTEVAILGTLKPSVPPETHNSKPHSTIDGPKVSLPAPGSRFHITTRVILADRSLWIPPERRLEPFKDHTHKWMISVDSPSYSLNITTILKRVKVTSLSDEHMMSSPLSTTDPPYVVVGTAASPFLARIELVFNEVLNPMQTDGETLEPEGQTVILEHWVDLDPMRSASAVMGEEQVVDVELDKGTKIAPVRTGYPAIGAKVLWDSGSGTQKGTTAPGASRSSKKAADEGDIQEYRKVLIGLLGKFPMTLKDVKGRVPHSVPYKLVSTPAALNSLVVGRRKAIEWGRARALRDAYEKAVLKLPTQDDLIPLTTADVYAWLSEEGHFPRVAAKPQVIDLSEVKKGNSERPKEIDHLKETHCRVCGLGLDMHVVGSSIKAEGGDPFKRDPATEDPKMHLLDQKMVFRSPSDNASEFVCNITPKELQMTRMPVLNSLEFPSQPTPPHPHGALRASGRKLNARDLVMTSHPQLVMSIRSLVQSLRLPSFDARTGEGVLGDSSTPRYPADELGADRGQIEGHLAPYALLALATKSFVRTLVDSGLEVANRDRAIALGLQAQAARKGGRKKSDKSDMRLLTPVHILSGVVTRGRGRGQRRSQEDLAVFQSLVRMGMPMEPLPTGVQDEDTRDDIEDEGSSDQDAVAQVKMEQH